MTPHISLVNRKVPYSAAVRHLMNMVRYYGPPTIFNTTMEGFIEARRTIKLHPSKAADTGTVIRTGMHYLNRIFNQISGAIKISAPMAAVAIQGMPD
jgi:hypothetical protein